MVKPVRDEAEAGRRTFSNICISRTSRVCIVAIALCLLSLSLFSACFCLFVPSTAAVCQLCFGEAASLGCKGAVDSCPWGVGIKENAALVATIVAGTTASTVFSIASLLPIRFRRLFPRNMTENVVPL